MTILYALASQFDYLFGFVLTQVAVVEWLDFRSHLVVISKVSPPSMLVVSALFSSISDSLCSSWPVRTFVAVTLIWGFSSGSHISALSR